MKIPFQTPVTLQSNLIQADVVMRLEGAVISRYAIFKSRSVYPAAGIVKQDRCSLEKRTFYQNGFKRVLNLRFQQSGPGTLLTGEFALRTPTLIFGTIWFGFLSLFSVMWLIELLRGNIHSFNQAPKGEAADPFDWIAQFIPFLMLGAGWLILQFGLWLSRRTEAEVLRFVERTASAQVIDDPMLLQSLSAPEHPLP